MSQLPSTLRSLYPKVCVQEGNLGIGGRTQSHTRPERIAPIASVEPTDDTRGLVVRYESVGCRVQWPFPLRLVSITKCIVATALPINAWIPAVTVAA